MIWAKDCNSTLHHGCALKLKLIAVHAITRICNSVGENVHVKVVRYVHAFRGWRQEILIAFAGTSVHAGILRKKS